MKNKIIAVMPIKLNNERLPGKNTMMLGSKHLLQYELDNLLEIAEIEQIYVYCSSDEICQFLPDNIVYKKRPPYLDLPTSNFTQIFQSFMKEHEADIYVYAHATAPFIKKETMQECINAVLNGRYDSAFCAEKIQDYLWSEGIPLNFNASNIPRSQDLKPVYRETSGIYVFKKEVFQKKLRRIGDMPYIKQVSFKEAVDINTIEDFKLAEALIDFDI